MNINKSSELFEVYNRIQQNFPTANHQYGELISRRIFRTAKYPYGEISYGEFLCDEISLRRNFLTAKFPPAKFPTAKFHTATFPSADNTYITCRKK